MAKGYLIGEDEVRRIVRSVLYTEMARQTVTPTTSPASRGVTSQAGKPRFSLARNTDPLDVPPYGITKITDTEEDLNGIRRFIVERPDGSGPYLIAGRAGIPNNSEHGLGGVSCDWPLEVAYDDAETPSVGEEWGPTTDSFLLSQDGSGFEILGSPAEDPDGGNKRVLVKEKGSGPGVVFPITLSKTGGSQGTDSTAATWTYTVTHAITGDELGTSVNPTTGNHQYVRPSIGQVSFADFGFAYFQANGDLVIGWINEQFNVEACA